jgi:hypothetical protein
MSLSDFTSGRTAKEIQWEREQVQLSLKRAEHEKTEALLSALRAFGADLPTGDELFKRWGIDRTRVKSR